MSAPFNLLIAEDDALLISSLRLMVPDSFKIYVTQDPQTIPEHIFFHAALVDMHIRSRVGERPDGPSVIEKLIKKNPQVEIVSMSGDLNRDNMDAAIKAGAQRFLAKPLLPEEVTLVLEKILAYWQLRQIEFSRHQKTRLIGQSDATETIRKKIAGLRNEKSSILIEGETGTGKDVVAQLINQQEGKAPFVTINCAAIPENLFESEFFGHVKGAFTGADNPKMGLAEAAHGGDLFLDEIEALPLTQQAKLLRFLESGEVRRVGAKESITVQTRIIVASNQNLTNMVQEKKFREDLYFRVSAHKIRLEPLRQRTADIESLANHFIQAERPRRNKHLSPEAVEALKDYAWPGNVRELKRVCEQLVLVSPLPVIREDDVLKLVRAESRAPLADEPSMNTTLNEFMNSQEKILIDFHVKKTKNLEAICQVLGISKSSLYKKIKDHGIIHE